MTRMRGASFASGEAPVGKQVSCRAKLPPNAPEIIVKHTITVSDPSCILYQHRDDRHRQFNSLVRRYKQQILHGCENPDCRTPTCLSFRRRTTEGPFRQYTDLSARTLACYLASQDNPERGLCRNPPKKSGEFLSAHTHKHSRNGDVEASQSSRYSGRGARHEPQQPPVSMNASIEMTENYDEDSVFSTSPKTKDPKSFTQNLFDTLSLRMVEWLPLRQTNTETHRHASPMLQGGRTPYPHAARRERNDKSPSQDESVDPRVHTHPVRNVATNEVHTPTNRQKKAHHPSLELRVSGQPLKRVSLEQTEPWIPTPRSATDSKPRSHRLSSQQSTPSKTLSQQNYVPPPALKHHSRRKGQHASNCNKKTANPRRVSWDGSKTSKETPNDTQKKELAKQKDSLDNSSPQMTPSQDLQDDSCKSEAACVAQCVSHLSVDIVDGLYQLLAGNEEDARTWKEEVENMNIQGRSRNYKWRYSTPRQRRAYLFVAQSVFYGLSSSQQLLRSFRQVSSSSHERQGFRGSGTIDFHTLESALRKIHEICPGDMILHSLWNSLERVFVPPEHLPTMRRSSRRTSQVSTGNRSPSLPSVSASEEPLSDMDAAHTLTVVIFVLITFLPKVDPQTWRGIQQVREAGTVLPSAEMQKLPLHSSSMLVDVTDKLENDMALRLVQRLVRALVVRLTFHDISRAMADPLSDAELLRAPSVLDLVFDNLCEHHKSSEKTVEQNQLPLALQSPVRAAVIVEWLRTLFLKEWDGKPEIAKSGTAGGVVQILSFMYKDRVRLGLNPEDFHTAFLSERLDAMEMPVEWYGRASTGSRKMHLLSFTFLFPPSALVRYFRAINYSAMSKAYEAGMIVQRQASQTAFNRTIQIADEISLLEHLHTSMTQYFVISVRRDHVLLDAFDQIWRRERRELMRPLKVKMGMDLGEEGVDLGGVQQEFMTLVFSEALDVDHGMFTVDPRTHMAWFQPCSFERLEYFELVGILMSLAVYNGLTLPVTFPTAFYRKLLGRKIKRIDHIRDGWPDLAKGLESLLTWSEGDVGDVFMRSYEFSFEAFGTVQTVDMKAIASDADWPGQSPLTPGPTGSRNSESAPKHDSEKDTVDSDTSTAEQASTGEPEIVTNETRNQYVDDYLYWLTDRSIRPQYEAFARGFFTCIDRISLSVFTPEALKTLVEGTQEIDMDELQRCATYDGGWDAGHPLIGAFWEIVKQYSREESARLLEFVTASDRIPVNGISSINFVIQRNGTGDDRLPTSYTCYGRLLLPEYTSPEVLAKNLDMALKNSRGFGNF